MGHKDLGCANGWSPIVWTLQDGSKRIEKLDTTPDEYKKCVSLKHKWTETKKGRCWYQVYCNICGITWDYDCSD